MGIQAGLSGDQWLAQDLEFIAGLIGEGEPLFNRRPVHPLSAVAGDDKVSVQYDPVSSQVSGLLHAAEDNLHGVMSMIQSAEIIHTFAEYAMVRGALECAAVAWWLLAPESRKDRLTRSLKLMWRDTLDMEEALGELAEIQARKNKRESEIRAAARAAGVPENEALGRLGYKSIMQELTKSTGIPALLTWQACSGMVHGRRWAMTALSTLEPKDDDGNSPMVHVKVSGSTEQLGRVVRVAKLCLVQAERLFRRRRIAAGNLSGAVSTMGCPGAIRTATVGFLSLSSVAALGPASPARGT